jgi:hypothetical protein
VVGGRWSVVADSSATSPIAGTSAKAGDLLRKASPAATPESASQRTRRSWLKATQAASMLKVMNDPASASVCSSLL